MTIRKTMSVESVDEARMYVIDALIGMEETNLKNWHPLAQRMGFTLRGIREMVQDGELLKAGHTIAVLISAVSTKFKEYMTNADKVSEVLDATLSNIAILYLREASDANADALDDVVEALDAKAVEQAKAAEDRMRSEATVH